MIGVEMRDEDRANLTAVDAGGLHVGRQVSGVRLPLSDAGAGVDHDELAADVQHHNGEGDWHELGRQPGVGERLFGVFN
jgi:hypothetical protein